MSFMWSLVFKMPLKVEKWSFLLVLFWLILFLANIYHAVHYTTVQKMSMSDLFFISRCLNCLPMPCRGSSCIHLPSTKSAGLEVSFYLLLLLYFFACVKSIFVFRLELLVCIPRLLPRSSTVTWLVSVWCFWSSSSDFVAPCLWRWKPQARKNSLREVLSYIV